MASPQPDWFLRQWLDSLHITQAEFERLTGWDKRKVSFLVTGKQPYKRDELNEAARALHLDPFELLLHPEDAFALRRMRESAIRIAAETRQPWHGTQGGEGLGSDWTSDPDHPRKAG